MKLHPMLALLLKRRSQTVRLRARRRQARPWPEGLEGRALLATTAPSLGYALDLGGPILQTWGHDLAVDGAGNTVVTGHFLGTTNFDPSNPGDTAATVTTPSFDYNGQARYASNAFIGRYDPSGNLLWLRVIGNSNGGSGEKVATDPIGNIYAAGEFDGTVTVGLDARNNPVSLTSSGSSDIYLVKYTSDGLVQWAQAIGGTDNNDSVRALTVDGSGNVFLSASFTGSTVVGGKSLSYTGGTNYLVKANTTDGSIAWVDQLAASINGLAVDQAGNPYLTGGFSGTVDFDPGPKTYSLYSGGRKVQPSGTAYVEKLNANGTFAWADAFQGGNWTLAGGAAIAVDGTGNVYSTGFYEDTIDFNPSSKANYPLTSVNGSNDVYVSKLDPRGNFVWAKSLGGSSADYGYGIAVDSSSGNIDLTGEFYGPADFDPGPGTYNLNPGTIPTVFVAQLDSAGAFDWAVSLGGATGEGRPSGLSVDDNGDIFTTGFFSGTADFDPGDGTLNLTAQSTTNEDAFLWKLTPSSQAALASSLPATGPAASAIQPLDTTLDDIAANLLHDQKRRATAGAG